MKTLTSMESRGGFWASISTHACCFILFCLLGARLACSQNQSCHSGDLDALRGFADGLKSSPPGWNVNDSSSSCCDWLGVVCGPPAISGRRVVGLVLRNRSLRGSISDALAGLDRLKRLDLSINNLQGPVPHRLFRLPLLENLSLSTNELAGVIPPDASLPAIQVFNVSCNYFTGHHPILAGSANLTLSDLTANKFHGAFDAGICNSSTKIQVLRLAMNSFSGAIPRGIKNCSSLVELSLGENSIAGNLPDELFEMPSLTQLSVQQNLLSGNLSTSIGNLSNLVLLDLSLNQFSGYIPDVFGNLPKLESFSAHSNHFVGDLPTSLSNSPSLKVLNLNNNSLSGEIDLNCTAMTSLSFLDLGSNAFSGTITDNLPQCVQLRTVNLAKNDLAGEIPRSFKNFVPLSDLSLTGNRISDISSALQILQHCPNLTILVLTKNFRGGETMPADGIQGFQKLEVLVIANCALSGAVPPWLANSPELEVLDLSWNYLSGAIPPWFGNLDNLFYLDLSNNSLTGELPSGLTRMKSLKHGGSSQNSSENFPFFIKKNSTGKGLQYNQISSFPSSLVLSHNMLVGPILPGFGELSHLYVLDLSWNNLSGSIPEDLSGMTDLETLDLSRNKLTGSIPSSLTNLSFLSNFDVAYNNLAGAVPTGGQFSTFSSSAFEGNPGLCGFHFSPCSSANPSPPRSRRHGRSAALGMAIGIGVATASLLVVAYFILLRARPRGREDNAKVVAHADEFSDPAGCRLVLLFQNKDNQELSIDDILRSTDNFDQAHIVGCGGFALVYGATLPDGRKVAIKRLSGDYCQMEKEFQAEVETLSRVQHENLVPLQGYCRVGNDRLLIYSYMENGSLDFWLHEKLHEGNSTLDWGRRLRIARGAARGLAYLHQSCEPHILHRDIKSSNILLDHEFEAHLADFGLARLILPYKTHVTTDLVGTLGYIPPEYGQSSVATFKGDVYSFGVVLLELLTGRRPVDMCRPKAHRNVVSWVLQMKNEKREIEVFDPSVCSKQHDREAMRMLEIACLCVSDSPKLRPSTSDLVAWLEELGHDEN
ncbi:phytosulfokine receptor 1-like [Musa acuminata AAA Group]|uniref:phytosulfokine receptor 1-like n=1 Tax=Musa acuminata AAA Group TaxID=214697 RepID=UPI0031CF66F9